MNSKNKVAVAMSGGVDSSVAALLLKQKGFDVIGITGKMQDNEASRQVADNALKVCDKIGIPHKVFDISDVFQQEVIQYFNNSYETGLTPNPCVVCNRAIKWGVLHEAAKQNFNTDFYATGHYAKIAENNGSYKLYRAKDDKKDQIYMLFSLTQNDLAKTLFPLGEYSKQEVRQIALYNDLPCAKSKESQDICFIVPPETAKKRLLSVFGKKQGNIADFETGKVIGTHDGFYQYTIGQRKGIGIAAPYPLYVIKTDAETNTIFVGYEKHLYRDELEAINANWQLAEYSGHEFRAMVKIRYNSSAKSATVIPQEGKKALVKFDEPQSAITSGQFAVFYDENNEFLIAGGEIL